jgi:hypothetical protein
VAESQQNAEARIFFEERSSRFHGIKRESVLGFQDPQWMCDFGLLVDITGPLNEINCCLQGKGQLIHTIYDPIKGFQTKRSLWERQLKANNCSHFPALAEVNCSGAYNSEKYSQDFGEFNDRFSDVKARKILIKRFLR